MKLYKSNLKNYLYLSYRLIRPIFDPIKFIVGLRGYVWMTTDLIRFKLLDPKQQIQFSDLFPVLDEKVNLTPFDAHYFFQQLWVFENVLKRKPISHVDIGSTYQMSGYLSKITHTTFIDIRPIDTKLKNLTVMKGDVLNLPLEDGSIDSLSCLHVIEHIGLGRYGDKINPKGPEIACKELARVLSKKGRLYLSTPVGKERICFNAHRIFDPRKIKRLFPGLKLASFAFIDDAGNLVQTDENPELAKNSNYACGLYEFKKK